MKLTHILHKQHIGKMFVKNWLAQGKKLVQDTGAHKILSERNIAVYEPNEILFEYKKDKVDIIGLLPNSITFDKTHPNWNDRVCHTFKDNNVLLEGLNQAKFITKTVEVKDGLPDSMILKHLPKDIDNRVKDIILYSHLFDGKQQKLPKVKDPLRPAWNFPRSYGITQNRTFKLLISKLLHLIEMNSGPRMVNERYIFNDLHFSFPFEKSGNLIQFQLRGDTVLTSCKPLPPVTDNQGEEITLPVLYPITETNTLNLENIYELKNIYPINKEVSKSHPHTIFINYNSQEVKNIYEEEVTEPQILGRSLLKTFTVAAAYAKKRYGASITRLPKPVTLQCVHTDGKWFHFGILQLNTLDLEGDEGIKNVWFRTSRIPLFTSCVYNLGKPTLEGYNNDVIKHLFAFYENV